MKRLMTNDVLLRISLTTAFLALFLGICGCASDCSSRHVEDLPPMPVEPKWVQLSEAPMAYTTNGVWETSSEFVEYGIQAVEWTQKVRRWKRENEIK